MKNLIKNILIIMIMFVIPTYVYAADETFSHIDIDQYVTLTYSVDGVSQTHSENLNKTNNSSSPFPSNVKLYRLEQDGSKTEITDATRSWQRDYNGTTGGRTRKYRYAKAFDKYYSGTDEEVKYIVEYTFNADVNGSTEEIVYEKEVSFSSNNDSNGTYNDVILVKLNGDTEENFVSPEIKINKVLTNGANDGTFNFSIKSYDDDSYNQSVQVVTSNDNGSSENIKLNANKKYIITEVDIANEYKFVSMDSSAKVDVDELPENSIVIETGDWGSNLTEVDVINTTKIDHSKHLDDNHDGTYQLSLDVKGENATGNANKANVIIIYDISGSMNYYLKSDTGQYGGRFTNNYPVPRADYFNSSTYQLYRWNGNNYVAIADSDNYTGTVYYYNNGWHTYNGQRYSSAVRLGTANQATLDMVEELLGYNEIEGNDSDTVEVALVTFNKTASKITFSNNTNWTTSYSMFQDRIPTSATEGTNWEDALIKAKEIADAKKNSGDNDQTYIIFVTDGNPSYYMSGTYNNNVDGTGIDTNTNNVNNSYEGAKDHAKDLVDSNYILYDVGIYGNADRMKDLTTYAYNSATEGAAHYFDASDTDQLYDAFDTILSAIKKSGIGAVSIADGTTQVVGIGTSTDTVGLLDIDTESGFEYWLQFPIQENGKIKFDDKEVTFNETSSGTYTLIHPDGSVSGIKGYVDDENNTFNYKWESRNTLYDVAPPAATVTNGVVNWDLSSAGLLLNDVTYSVKFNVWPSQYTYDLIAALKNGLDYNTLDPNIRLYLSEDGSLRTNTTASVSYTDSRGNSGTITNRFINPDPVPTDSQQVKVKKDIINDLDTRNVDKVELDLLRNGNSYGNTISLASSDDPSWEGSTYISVGLISTVKDKDGKITDIKVRTPGYDYSFDEVKAYLNGQQVSTYHWDLVADVVHPMIVDTGVVMLVKTNKVTLDDFNGKNVILDGNTIKYYKIGNNVYEVKSGLNANFISAQNIRRANLNLTKEIQGSAPSDTQYTFRVKIDSADESEIWFSIYESPTSTVVVRDTGIVEGAIAEEGNTGFYHVASGQEFTINMKAGWNFRTTNLPIYSKYEITEILTNDFRLLDASLKLSYLTDKTKPTEFTYENPDSSYVTIDLDNKKVSGDIYVGNRNYHVTYTNEYILTSVSGDKIWHDSGENRPTSLVVNLLRNGTKIDSKTIGNGNWHYDFINLPKYNSNGDLYVYSVDEEDVPVNYRKELDNNNIINTELTTFEGRKIWEDNNNKDGKRPEDITIKLYANDEYTGKSMVINDENDWAFYFDNLDKYDSNNRLIRYTVEEVLPDDMKDKYVISIHGNDITNTYKDTPISITVTKKWVHKIGTKVEVEIYTETEGVVFTPIRETITGDATSDTWRKTIDNLPKYYYDRDNDRLIEIKYKVRELSIDGKPLTDSQLKIYHDVFENQLMGTWTAEVEDLTITNTWDEVETVPFSFKKVSFNDLDTSLTGAVFRLYRCIIDNNTDDSLLSLNPSEIDSSKWILVMELRSDDTGVYDFGNLYDGEYRLIEVQAPKGHVLPQGQWKITIKPSSDEEIKIVGIGAIPGLIEVQNGKYLIPNKEIPDIPSTGGIGIPHYNQYGLLLIILSISMYIINVLSNKKIKNIEGV